MGIAAIAAADDGRDAIGVIVGVAIASGGGEGGGIGRGRVSSGGVGSVDTYGREW